MTLDAVESGASVVAIYPGEPGLSVSVVVAFVAVQPGDHLTVGDGYQRFNAGGAAGTMTVEFPALPGAAYFYANHPCTANGLFDGTATSITLDLYASCQVPTASVELVAFDKEGNLYRIGVVHDAAYIPGSVATLPAWASPWPFTLDVSGLPATVETVDLNALSVIGGKIYPLQIEGEYGLVPQAGAANATGLVVEGADRISAAAAAWRSNFGAHATIVGLSPDANSASFVEPPLPWLGEVTVNAADRSASWAQEPGTSSGDGAIGVASWLRFDPEIGMNRAYRWVLVVPPGVTGWQWPEGPTELAPYLPTGGDSIDASVSVLDFASAADYDAFRALPEWVLSCPSCAINAGDTPEVAVSTSYLPPPE